MSLALQVFLTDAQECLTVSRISNHQECLFKFLTLSEFSELQENGNVSREKEQRAEVPETTEKWKFSIIISSPLMNYFFFFFSLSKCFSLSQAVLDHSAFSSQDTGAKPAVK